MIHLVTGATEGYPWADAYWQSVLKFVKETNRENDSPFWEVMPYFFEHPKDWPADCGDVMLPVNILKHKFAVKLPENRTKCMQHGSFMDYLIPEGHKDVAIFTDADMIMQRAFNVEEMTMLTSLRRGAILIGRNGREGDTLLDEADLLVQHAGKNLDWALFKKLLPGWEELPVYNTGVMVANVETWRRLRDMVETLLPVCETMFNHYAALQFCISYCVGRWLRRGVLPLTFHVHGHFGLPEELSWDAEGNACIEVNETEGVTTYEKAVFRHCLNLTPAKGPGPK